MLESNIILTSIKVDSKMKNSPPNYTTETNTEQIILEFPNNVSKRMKELGTVLKILSGRVTNRERNLNGMPGPCS